MAVVAPSVQAFLDRGFLPENLPPSFTSAALWPIYSAAGTNYMVTSRAEGALAPFIASKRGRQRRTFNLPHPTFFRDQALFLELKWPNISPLLGSSPGSLSKPEFRDDSVRAVKITPHGELPALRLKAFSRYRYCVVTDIARCYPSIYTHSIPWAINGKAEAKADNKPDSVKVYGNKLDFLIRQAQERQTVGIPIGNDVSRVVAEIVLCAIDRTFLSMYGAGVPPAYLRHVDDYWIAGNSIDECNLHLARLRAVLREFELDINELKTRTLSTNYILGETWPAEIENELKRVVNPFSSLSSDDVVATLSKILVKADAENDDGIVRRLIKRLDETKSWVKHWDVLEPFLAQCSIQFSHSFDYVARVVSWIKRTGRPLDEPLWTIVSQDVCFQSALLGRDSEVLWALWLLKELNISIAGKLTEAILANSGPLPMEFLAHFFKHGMTEDKSLDHALWSRVEANKYSGKNWPLSMELFHLDIPDTSGIAAQGVDAVVEILHKNKVSLIDWSAAPAVFAVQPGPGKKNIPVKAIEAFSSDYDGDDQEDLFEDEVDDVF
jgi:hypothetical protein